MNTTANPTHRRLQPLCLLLGSLLVSGCQSLAPRNEPSLAANLPAIEHSLAPSPASAPRESAPQPPAEVQAALLPPLSMALPRAAAPSEPRFDIAVNQVPARRFFMGLVEDTPYNMVVHPEVEGMISLNLKNITVDEVMQTVRDVYGYEYRKLGSVYQVMPARMRSRIFKIDYLNVQRSGTSRTRVSSGQVSETAASNSSEGSDGTSSTDSSSEGSGTPTTSVSGSEVETRSQSDFWEELKQALTMLIGDEGGRRVVLNPQAGIIVVRAMPGELRDVEDYLATLQNVVQRQVILEAKIIEVELNDGFQSGINWGAIGRPAKGETLQAGQIGGGRIFSDGTSSLVDGTATLQPGLTTTSLVTSTFGGMFVLNINANDFNALIELLKTQGKVQVLSSPRISTVNNQKAVIKVGTDEFFVTDVDTQTTTTSTASLNQNVNVQLTPFFSGVALDVIPQIDEEGNVVLHIHPTVSEVTEKTKEINVSTTTTLSVPLALSSIRESDTIIRARSGQVVVIGGLMKDQQRDDLAKTPMLGDLPLLGGLFQHQRQRKTKSELVILLRPIVVGEGQGEWNPVLQSSAERFRALQGAPRSD
ncbi:pilus (MSHA type) biogenesis protein MshL [Thiohalobacter sp. IOR34]|uniref:pilus (MSHA type) biogenesis protein MshL n=1 Tax=Thiohalobacter sp. IOR34 TaxID=3057176 RepID=UPI0025B17ECE|nr:pilus (MSHA type) biogenesis protein MshL [Thiohalobacter sp. IOR34]WJW75537.1 pilus (MSHA type) biogenesis protein MshL [Thiohalobacter sp. IOR34]